MVEAQLDGLHLLQTREPLAFALWQEVRPDDCARGVIIAGKSAARRQSGGEKQAEKKSAQDHAPNVCIHPACGKRRLHVII